MTVISSTSKSKI